MAKRRCSQVGTWKRRKSGSGWSKHRRYGWKIEAQRFCRKRRKKRVIPIPKGGSVSYFNFTKDVKELLRSYNSGDWHSAITQWIRQSNLIEGIDDPEEDRRSLRAWRWLLKQELSLETILILHRKITRIQMRKEGKGWGIGKWRTCRVWVGDREGAPHAEIPILMADWLEQHGQFKRSLYLNVPHWAKAAHIAFEKIHPFLDGNGRTGRMLMNWMRIKTGFLPLFIEASKRWEYYKWFKED